MAYDWNPVKAETNLAKHGVAFNAMADFEWNTARVQADTRAHYGEIRLTAKGMIGDDLFVLVFTIRRNLIWIISLRRANRKEVRSYVSEA